MITRIAPFTYTSGNNGGGTPAGTAQGPAAPGAAPDATPGQVPSSLPGMISAAFNGTGKSSLSSMESTLANLGIKGLGMLTGLPTAPFTLTPMVLAQLTELALKHGLQGQDVNLGLSQEGINQALNIDQGSGPNVSAALSQGLPGTAAQQAMQSLYSGLSPFSFGRNGEPDLGVRGPTPTLADVLNGLVSATQGAIPDGNFTANTNMSMPDVDLSGDYSGPGVPAGTPGTPAGVPSGDAPPGVTGEGNGDLHSGGTIPGKGNRDTFKARLTPGEFVVNPKAAKLHRSLLEAINSGATKAELAGMMKAGKR